MDEITFSAAFSAGLLSFLSPCVLPLVPVYLASLAGPEIFQPGLSKNRLAIFFHSLSFVIGFSLVFVFMGASAGLLGFAIGPHLELAYQIAGGILIALGLFMLASLKFPQLNYERRLSPLTGNSTGYLRSFIIGAAFPVAWIPCTGPLLGSILVLAGASETAWSGAYLLAIYSLGLGLPFLTVGAAFGIITPLLKAIQRYANIVYIVSGVLLVALGILILTGNLTLLYI